MLKENVNSTPKDIETTYQKINKVLTDLEHTLDSYRDVIDDDYANELKETVQSLQEAEEDLIVERLLNLGIVGQVNSGKSTLLNVLLFEGREVLPHSATPMTASLTKIQWSNKNEIDVEYYSHEDWAEFEKHAEIYNNYLDQDKQTTNKSIVSETLTVRQEQILRSAHELIQMARKRQLCVHDYLGKVETHKASNDNLNEILLDLVGVQGTFTPLVKSINIRCDYGIKGLNIIDTPGINDPVISRSRVTKQYLRKCDAVLMLSYSSQFIEVEDLKFFKSAIPDSGIENRLLIGSKFDSVLIDVSFDRDGDLIDAVQSTTERLRKHATNVIHKEGLHHLFQDFEGMVKFVSAICGSLLQKPIHTWNKYEQEGFNNLYEAYPDWFDKPVNGVIDESTKANLKRVENMQGIRDYISSIQLNKNSIMDEKSRDFLDAKCRNLNQQICHLERILESNFQDLDQGSVQETKMRIENLTLEQSKFHDQLQEKWNDLLNNHLSQFIDLTHKTIEEKIVKKDEINQKSLLTEYEEVDRPGFFQWLLRVFGIGGKEIVTYANKIEVTEEIKNQIDDYIDRIRMDFEKYVERMFQPEYRDHARNEMIRVLAQNLTSENATNLDIEKMKQLIWRAVGRLCISAKENLEKANLQLYKKTGEDRGAELLIKLDPEEELTDSHFVDIVIGIANDLIHETKSLKEKILEIGNQLKEELMPEIGNILKSEKARLEADLKNREFRKQRYEFALKAVKQCHDQLNKVNLK